MTNEKTQKKEYRVGIVGDGLLTRAMLEILWKERPGGVFNKVRVVGIVIPNAQAPNIDMLRLDVPVYTSKEDLLACHPDLDILFDLEMDKSGTVGHAGVSLIDQNAVTFLTELFDDEPVAESCQIDFSRTRTLLDTIVDEIKDEIILLDPKGLIMDLNKVAYSRTGKDRNDFYGRYIWEAFDAFPNFCTLPRDDVQLWSAVAHDQRGEEVQSQVDPDGRMLYFKVFAYPVKNTSGELGNIVILRRDITQRTFMEHRLQKAERLAAIGELSTFIAHEIRNPLFAIAGFANSLLRSNTLVDKDREKVGIIIEESNRLDKILKSIINFARPTQGTTGEVELATLIKSTMDIMSMSCKKQDIEVFVELPDKIPNVKGDAELLRQSLINLIKNSMEAMPDGGTIIVSVTTQRDMVRVTVKDTGRGIEPDHLDQVFNPFFSTKDQGSGLGLPMIKKILDDIGGGIDVKSRVGEGTTITLTLPPYFAVPGKKTI
ncbi:two-component system sensor histidine kinase NtrB [Desulfovibrio inopinatus]|uniref:two-component system sensor histidine kinase NtrB n=1 Tax=Desulfovibrio inopinatus TaxID=102109 RepID=UPI00040EDA4C|nr:ATP-binding protein [Desulfovibrio inopinatus]